MNNAFLVTPQKNQSFVKEEIYKKGSATFSIISTWKSCVLIVENIQ